MQKEIETRAEKLWINPWSPVGKDGEKYAEIEMEV